MTMFILFHAYHSSRLTTAQLKRLARAYGLDEQVESLNFNAPGAREHLTDAVWYEATDTPPALVERRFLEAAGYGE
jgi:hypothetical protein